MLYSAVWLPFGDWQESENKDLSQQLASQTQTRLALTDKYDEASKDQRQWKNRLQTKQAEVDSSKVNSNSGVLSVVDRADVTTSYSRSSPSYRLRSRPCAQLRAHLDPLPRSLISRLAPQEQNDTSPRLRHSWLMPSRSLVRPARRLLSQRENGKLASRSLSGW